MTQAEIPNLQLPGSRIMGKCDHLPKTYSSLSQWLLQFSLGNLTRHSSPCFVGTYAMLTLDISEEMSHHVTAVTRPGMD